jgi:hypothetical protein
MYLYDLFVNIFLCVEIPSVDVRFCAKRCVWKCMENDDLSMQINEKDLYAKTNGRFAN